MPALVPVLETRRGASPVPGWEDRAVRRTRIGVGTQWGGGGAGPAETWQLGARQRQRRQRGGGALQGCLGGGQRFLEHGTRNTHHIIKGQKLDLQLKTSVQQRTLRRACKGKAQAGEDTGNNRHRQGLLWRSSG